ncbi:unnamed protein product [Sphagnum balticum]
MKLEAGGKQETNPLTLAVHLVQQRNKIKKKQAQPLLCRRQSQAQEETKPQVHETRRDKTILSLLFTKVSRLDCASGPKGGRKAVVTEKVELGTKAHGKSSSRHALGVRALHTGAVRRTGPKAHRQGRCRQPRRSLKL